MFLTAPILWLQSWASPGLTRTMEVVSWFGYTRSAIALTVLVAFAFRLRPALALLILLGFNSLAIDLVKTAAALPRPFALDARVHVLGWPGPSTVQWAGTGASGIWDLPRAIPLLTTNSGGGTANAVDSETGFGFPSGHVSTAATFAAGLAAFAGWRWMRWAGAGWVLLMALSRLYLGRHFVGDVIGGLVLATVLFVIGTKVLRLRDLARGESGVSGVARLNAGVAAALVAIALVAGSPDLGDTARLAGITLGVLLLIRLGVADLPPRWTTRAGLVVTAAVAYGLVWAAVTFGPRLADVPGGPAIRLAAGALPAFATLVVPGLWILRTRVAAAGGRG